MSGLSGAIAAGNLVTRADNVAQQADDFFILRTGDKTLWFDQDGSGAGAAVAAGRPAINGKPDGRRHHLRLARLAVSSSAR